MADLTLAMNIIGIIIGSLIILFLLGLLIWMFWWRSSTHRGRNASDNDTDEILKQVEKNRKTAQAYQSLALKSRA